MAGRSAVVTFVALRLGDYIFLTTFADDQLQTRCYDQRTRNLLWTRGLKVEKLETYHNSEGSPAAATPATDGDRVVSYFGSFGLVCYDFKGNEVWKHPLPVAQSHGGFGSGTSPIIFAKRFVILNRDQMEKSSVMALDLRNGKTVWETARPDASGSFGTPIIWHNNKIDEVITPGSLRVQGYDLKSGKGRWMIEPVTTFACTTPVFGDGLLFFAGWSPGKSDSPWPSWASFLERSDKNKDGEITFDEFGPGERDFARAWISTATGKSQKWIGTLCKRGLQGREPAACNQTRRNRRHHSNTRRLEVQSWSTLRGLSPLL